MTPIEAAALLRGVYGIDARVHALTGEADENFRIRSSEGDFILKVARLEADPGVVDLSAAALLHIEGRAPGFPCPRVRTDLQGRTVATITDANEAPRLAHLLTWLPGRQLESLPPSRELRRACGTMAAHAARALRDFSHPAAGRRMLWDVCQLPALREVLAEVPQHPQAAFIARFLDEFEASTTGVLPRLRRQVLHNDMNLRNVLVDADDSTRIAGLIDFGDIVETAVAADVAVVASTQLLRGSAAVEADVMDTVEGYRAVEPLDDEEMAVLPWLIAGRLVCGLLIPVWHLARNRTSRHYPAKSEAAIAMRVAMIEAAKRLRMH